MCVGSKMNNGRRYLVADDVPIPVWNALKMKKGIPNFHERSLMWMDSKIFFVEFPGL